MINYYINSIKNETLNFNINYKRIYLCIMENNSWLGSKVSATHKLGAARCLMNV